MGKYHVFYRGYLPIDSPKEKLYPSIHWLIPPGHCHMYIIHYLVSALGGWRKPVYMDTTTVHIGDKISTDLTSGPSVRSNVGVPNNCVCSSTHGTHSRIVNWAPAVLVTQYWFSCTNVLVYYPLSQSIWWPYTGVVIIGFFSSTNAWTA